MQIMFKVFASHEVIVFQNFKVLTILRLLFKITTIATQNSILDDNWFSYHSIRIGEVWKNETWHKRCDERVIKEISNANRYITENIPPRFFTWEKGKNNFLFCFWLHEEKAKTIQKKRLLVVMISNTHTVCCQQQTKFSWIIKHKQ